MNEPTPELQERIAAYIDGQLSPTEAARLEVFLANTDRALADQVIGMIADKHRIKLLPKPAAPRDLAARVMEQVERSSLLDGVEQFSRSRRPWWQSRAAIAAGVAILLGGFSYVMVTSVLRPSHGNKYQEMVADAGKAGPASVAAPPSVAGPAVLDAGKAAPQMLAKGGDGDAFKRAAERTDVALKDGTEQRAATEASGQVTDQVIAKAAVAPSTPPTMSPESAATQHQIAATPGITAGTQIASAGPNVTNLNGGAPGAAAGRRGAVGGGGRGGRGGGFGGSGIAGGGGGGFGAGGAAAGSLGAAQDSPNRAVALGPSRNSDGVVDNAATLAGPENALKALATLREIGGNEPIIVTLTARDANDPPKLQAALSSFGVQPLAQGNTFNGTLSLGNTQQQATSGNYNQYRQNNEMNQTGNNITVAPTSQVGGQALSMGGGNQGNVSNANDRQISLNGANNFALRNGDAGGVFRGSLRPEQLESLLRDFRVQAIARGKDLYLFRVQGDQTPLAADATVKDELMRRAQGNLTDNRGVASVTAPAASAAMQMKESQAAPTQDKQPGPSSLLDVIVTMEPPVASASPASAPVPR